MSLGIIVQARCGSRRLPNKIWMKIGNQKIIEHVINRLKLVKIKKNIIIATTRQARDKKIVKLAKKNNCNYYSGSEKNVLKRYYRAAKKFKIKTIVRICSDSPFIDPVIIEKVVKFFKKNKSDYTSNIIKPTYPAGMSVEVFKFKSLKKTYKSKTDDIEKEHVTPFIYRNPKLFNIKNFKNKKNLSKYRFAVDYANDLIACRKIYKIINKKLNHKYHLKNLIKIVDSNPSIKKINYKIKTTLRF